MTPRRYHVLQHWLEYIKPQTWRWWVEGGYWIDRNGDAR